MPDESSTHILYHHPRSICSIMVRFSFACRGNVKGGVSEILLRETVIDILNGEQLSEHFLCKVNENGEVPVLVPIDGSAPPLPDSVAITFKLAETYPDIAPASHEEEIRRLVKELHEISFFALTFAGRPRGQQSAKHMLEQRLSEEGISKEYAKAIRRKIERIDSVKLAALTDDTLQTNIIRTEKYLTKIDGILTASKTSWCFDLERPSALDTHVITFVARLRDIDRSALVPECVMKYAEKAMAGPEWLSVMGAGTTKP